ncbi:MAG: type II secretion system F family protein, partial [Bacteroidota bacterium]
MPVQEFRFVGVGQAGQPVQGTVFAPSRKAANKKVDDLSRKHQFRLNALQQRRVYRYKARHATGKIVDGEQKAFSEEEISGALKKMGLEVVRVDKKILNIQRKPPQQDLIMFVRLSANLLKEKLPFDEVLNLLVNDVSSKSLRQVIRDLNADLKGGMEAQQAFMKHQHHLGKFTAYMLGIASQSGNMSEIYEATARFLERQNEFKKSIRSSMITPAITVAVLIATFVWYVWYIFPQTAGLFADMGVDLPYMTAKTLEFSYWMDANYGWVLLFSALSIGGFVAFARSDRGKFLIHKHLIQMPVIGSLLHKLNIEIFCRVFAVLYS